MLRITLFLKGLQSRLPTVCLLHINHFYQTQYVRGAKLQKQISYQTANALLLLPAVGDYRAIDCTVIPDLYQ